MAILINLLYVVNINHREITVATSLCATESSEPGAAAAEEQILPTDEGRQVRAHLSHGRSARDGARAPARPHAVDPGDRRPPHKRPAQPTAGTATRLQRVRHGAARDRLARLDHIINHLSIWFRSGGIRGSMFNLILCLHEIQAFHELTHPVPITHGTSYYVSVDRSIHYAY